MNSLPFLRYINKNRILTLFKNSLLKVFMVSFVFQLMGSSFVFAKQVDSILVTGNKKIEKDAITEKLIHKVGSQLSLADVKNEVQKLFSTGYFQDIEVDEAAGKNGGVQLTYKVVEKPSITSIEYNGNSEIDDDAVSELTKLKVFEIIDYAKITRGVADIQKAYEEKGYFLAKVSYKVEKDGADGVKVVFTVEENAQVLVKRVSFIGNTQVPSSDLKERMLTQEGGFFSGLSGSGTYKQDAFEQDIQLLSFLYFNKGYVQAKVSRPEVTVTPDKKGIYISIRVEEGMQFNTGEVSFSGDLLFPTEELNEVAKIDESEIFVYETVQSDIRDFTAKYGDLGYAYTNVIPRTFIREDERKVDIVYEFDKGKKVYFGTINVIGNSRTRDKVVRRELRIGEGELYNETRKRESLDNIRRLGFFEQVEFNQKTPPGRDDLMDIDITVKERNTGSFQLGAGYSSYSGVIFNAQLNQTNFLGKGQNVGLQIDYSRLQKRYRINFTEPYFLDTFWTVGFDIFRNDNNIPQLYRETVEGAALRVGHPIYGRYFYGFLRYKLDNTQLTMTPGQYATDVLKPEGATGISSSVTASVEYDKRNDRFAPSKGVHTSASYEVAGIWGDLQYSKADTFFRWYKTLFWSVVLRTNFEYGFVQTPSDREIPFTKRYRLGGPYNMRGFDFSHIGQRRFSSDRYNYLTCDPTTFPNNPANPRNCYTDLNNARNVANVVLGGAQQALAMIEIVFPIVKEAQINGVLFYDVGAAEDKLSASAFREDIGFGVRWLSPIGPLRFEWGFPLDRKTELQEGSSKFQFAIGAPF
jgi:outer membrane protein insertion porin family